jgi:hypothetical protein
MSTIIQAGPLEKVSQELTTITFAGTARQHCSISIPTHFRH